MELQDNGGASRHPTIILEIVTFGFAFIFPFSFAQSGKLRLIQ
jgi:hypothetical protein